MTFATSHVGDLEESGVLTHNQFPLSDPMPTFFYNVRIVMGASVVDALCRALRIGCSKAENQVEMKMVLPFTQRTRAWSNTLTGSRFSHNSPDQELKRLSGCL